MAPRYTQIGLALLLAALGWASSWRGGASHSASTLERLAESAVQAVARHERVPASEVRVREVGRISTDLRRAGCASSASGDAARFPGYRIVLVANNTIYEYHGAADCIVSVPRSPDGWASGVETEPAARALARGAKTDAKLPARPANLWQTVGAEEERAEASRTYRLAENDSVFRLHLGYHPAASATLARPMP